VFCGISIQSICGESGYVDHATQAQIPRNIFCGATSGIIYCIKPHTVQELQLETVAIVNNIPSDMLCEKADSSVVCLQHIPAGKGCVHMQTI